MARGTLCRHPRSLGLLLALQLWVALTDAATTPDKRSILIFDAGSTGTRLNIFEFSTDSRRATGLRITGVKEKKISPGLSSYANAPNRIREALAPLIDFAKTIVPGTHRSRTFAIVRATAGLRLLAENQRRGIIRTVDEVLRRSTFKVPDSESGAVSIITGQEEALNAWVTVNFLLGALDQPDGGTYGMLDLGGGSTQIAFEPMTDNPSDPGRAVFTTASGRSYPLYTRSYLGLGMSQITMSIFGYSASSRKLDFYGLPCVNEQFSADFTFGPTTIRVGGVQGNPEPKSGIFELCGALSSANLIDSSFRFIVEKPPTAKVAKFAGISAFYYTAKMLQKGGFWRKKMPGEATIRDLKDAGKRVCPNPPKTGKFEPYLCLNTAYISTLLTHSGYQFPEGQSIKFVDKINGYSATWALGLAINYLSQAGAS